VSDRLALALIEHIRRIDAQAKFLVIEAVPLPLAQSLHSHWDGSDPNLPRLAIATSQDDLRFGNHGLQGASVATLRNRSPKGVCIVVCENAQLAERQSIINFMPVSPADLLESKDRLMLLGEAETKVQPDGYMAAVREAIATMPPSLRPSASAVASYFDRVASGELARIALPNIGAFQDSCSPAEIRGERIRENLILASRRSSGDVISSDDFSRIRSRAERVLSRPSSGPTTADEFMEMLENGDDRILFAVSYDEAREILSETSKGLAAQTTEALQDYTRTLQPGRLEQIPIDVYLAEANRLDEVESRRAAARTLLEFDAVEGGAVFEPTLRRRLSALLRERRIDATPGSCPEAGLARAVAVIGGAPNSLSVVEPVPDDDPTGARQACDQLTLAMARMRLAPVLRSLVSQGCEVDPLLIGDVLRPDITTARQWFVEACLDRNRMSTLRMRVAGVEDAVEVTWAPDHDDAALLRCVLEFSEQPALTLTTRTHPDARLVASCDGISRERVSDATDPLARRLKQLCTDILKDGLSPDRLRIWVTDWTEFVEESHAFDGEAEAEALSTAGCVARTPEQGSIGTAYGMSGVAPLKAEWLADYLETARDVVYKRLDNTADDVSGTEMAHDVACQALQEVTAAHCPAFLRLGDSDTPLLPTKESRIWSVFGGDAELLDFELHALNAVTRVIRRLVRLQPEVAGHLRCLSLGPGAASLMLKLAVDIAGSKLGEVTVRVIELYVVGDNPELDDTLRNALADADDKFTANEQGELRLRYFDNLTDALDKLGSHHATVHFALFTGLTAGDRSPQIDHVDIELRDVAYEPEVLFSPRLSLRPGYDQRAVLAPPTPSIAAVAWLRLANAIDDVWPEDGARLNVPELRVRALGSRAELRRLHELATWVATLDRYATRDSLERALRGEVAILHQERRLGSDSPLGMVVSQRSGGPVDRAIGRSLRNAGIVQSPTDSTGIGEQLRQVATQGYGVLALEAATSGTGINELVGHVVGFSMLGTESTPWPLPLGCRLLLLSLDEHAEWFMGQRRADLLAVAVDTKDGGIHGAIIEVKARRSDATRADAEALDQIRRSLVATSFAAQPVQGDIASRVWLNRIAEALYAVARESSIRLDAQELEAIEAFRAGIGTLEWAGLGLVFGPELIDDRRVYHHQIGSDQVPIAMRSVRLTEERLRAAVGTNLRDFRTTEATEQPLGGGRVRRRPESGVARPERRSTDEPDGDTTSEHSASQDSDQGGSQDGDEQSMDIDEAATQTLTSIMAANLTPHPILGHDAFSGEPVEWRVTGTEALANGHVQIWGSSGAGKTQFVKMLLAQLSATGTHFGIADFKNDYGPDARENFPASVGATFHDLWGQPGAPYNPLALAEGENRDTRVIELRDAIEEAISSYQRIGTRQKHAVEEALRATYKDAQAEGRYPTMLDLSNHLPDSVRHILGDLTQYQIFTDGPPLGEVISENMVFGLNRIPGNGQTTVLAGAFLLSSIGLAIQGMEPVANTIRYAVVVDEAHRVARIRAVDLMVKEGRSKGLAVILATQSPGDLPETVDTNAQTRICFRLSDAIVATQAARKLDSNDRTLAERIRTLGTGEALVSMEGQHPLSVRMLQHYRDNTMLDVRRNV